MTPDAALAQLNQLQGVRLTLEGRCPGGEVGAYFAVSEDGERFVFKWSEASNRFNHFTAVVDRIDRLRRRGFPIPLHFAPVVVPGGVIFRQRAVPGAWRDDVSIEFVDQLMALNDLQAGIGEDAASWSDWMRSTLTEGANGYCVHESLRSHDGETRRLLAWIEEIGRDYRTLPALDIVHVDFHHRNVLRIGSRISAVVDWEGCVEGDRAFDRVTFCFGFSHASSEPGAESRVWERACELAPVEVLAPYVAHMALRRVDWSIRYHREEVKCRVGDPEGSTVLFDRLPLTEKLVGFSELSDHLLGRMPVSFHRVVLLPNAGPRTRSAGRDSDHNS